MPKSRKKLAAVFSPGVSATDSVPSQTNSKNVVSGGTVGVIGGGVASNIGGGVAARDSGANSHGMTPTNGASGGAVSVGGGGVAVQPSA